MRLEHVKLANAVYCHVPTGKIVDVLNCYFYDGACLIVESRDENGDIFSGDIFTCEASQLAPCTRTHWEERYPSNNPDHYSFDEMVVKYEESDPKKDFFQNITAVRSQLTNHGSFIDFRWIQTA